MCVFGSQLGYITQHSLLPPSTQLAWQAGTPSLLGTALGKGIQNGCLYFHLYFSFGAVFLDSREVTSAAGDRKEQNESSQALMRCMRDPSWEGQVRPHRARGEFCLGALGGTGAELS